MSWWRHRVRSVPHKKALLCRKLRRTGARLTAGPNRQQNRSAAEELTMAASKNQQLGTKSCLCTTDICSCAPTASLLSTENGTIVPTRSRPHDGLEPTRLARPVWPRSSLEAFDDPEPRARDGTQLLGPGVSIPGRVGCSGKTRASGVIYFQRSLKLRLR